MLTHGLNASDFCTTVVQGEINRGGLASDKLVVVLYSGPADKIRKALHYRVRTNWQRARDQVTRLGASWIDDTNTAQFLNGMDLRKYFADFYGMNVDAIHNAEAKVWGYTSEKFVSGNFEEVATAVCGADITRVFRKYEQAALLENPYIKVANGRPVGMFREFHAVDPYEAFRLFCITELLEIRKHAKNKGTKKAKQDYRIRRKFFLAERRDTIKASPVSQDVKTKIKQQRKNILTTYSLAEFSGIDAGIASVPSSVAKITASGAHPA